MAHVLAEVIFSPHYGNMIFTGGEIG